MAQEPDEAEGGFNIEGLAATPEGDLIVGLRAPLTNDNKARLVRIENPLALLGLSGKPADATVHELPPLNLGGGGIRSIERVGTGDRAYLIVAGPSGAEPASSTLRWWDGTAKVGTEHEVSLNGATPEAVLMLGAGSIGVLGDNESQCSDKDDFTGARWFPALEIDEIGSERISVRWEAK